MNNIYKEIMVLFFLLVVTQKCISGVTFPVTNKKVKGVTVRVSGERMANTAQHIAKKSSAALIIRDTFGNCLYHLAADNLNYKLINEIAKCVPFLNPDMLNAQLKMPQDIIDSEQKNVLKTLNKEDVLKALEHSNDKMMPKLIAHQDQINHCYKALDQARKKYQKMIEIGLEIQK